MPIIVVGGGIIGLYTSIHLARKKFTVNVVDKYANNFSRPGVVAVQAGEIVTKQLDSIGININIPEANSLPNTYFIRNIQEELYKAAKNLKVQFTNSYFKGIQDNSVILEHGQSVKCDLLIDCSGESREVVNYVNAENKANIFTISQIADNPVKTHFIAYITMSEEDAELLTDYMGTKSSVNEVRQFEKLRALGWTQNDMPHWDMRQWGFGKKIHRFCCYFEMPDELARAPEPKQKEWLSIMLELKAGKEIDFKIELDSPLKFRPFIVNPHRVETLFHESDLYPFPIAVCGDALMSAGYSKGTGISNGVICSNGLTSAISFVENRFHINPQIFYSTITDYRNPKICIDTQLKEIRDLYQSRRNNLINPKLQIAKLSKYHEVLALSPHDQLIIKGLLHQISELKKIADLAFLAKDFEKACLAYEEAFEACKKLEKNSYIESPELVKLYNLEARICSNLEKTYRNQKNQTKTEKYLNESIKACNKALALLKNPASQEFEKLKEGLLSLQKNLEAKTVPSQGLNSNSSTVR